MVSILPPFLPDSLRARLESPVTELIVHFIVSVYAIFFIAATEFFLGILGLGKEMLPIFDVSLSRWLFGFEVFSVSVILLTGLVKALIRDSIQV